MRSKTRTARNAVLLAVLAVGLAATGFAVAESDPPASNPASQATAIETTETTTKTTGIANETTSTAGTTTEASEPSETAGAETTESETTATETADGATATETAQTTTETTDGVEYPPGVTSEGVVNASALVAAHQDALAETGYEFTFYENTSFEGVVPEYLENETGNLTDESFYFFNDTTTVTAENGTVARGLAPGRLVSTGYLSYDEYRHEFRSDTWANESVMLSRTEYANQLLLQRADLLREPGVDPFVVARSDINATFTKADVVNLTLHSGEFEVAETERVDNRTLTTLDAVEYDGYDALWISPENVTAYDATVVVDERGRVHRLSLSVEGTEYEHISMRYEFELTHLGPVEVSHPDWTESLRSDNSSSTASG